MILLLLLSLSTYSAPKVKLQGPCDRKLLATGDQARDTEQFTLYLQILIEENVVSLIDLSAFFQALQTDQLVNPIPATGSLAKLNFHHNEFKSLMETGKVDLTQIKAWWQQYRKVRQEIENQKQVAAENTETLPIIVTQSGAMFFKFKHPLLGDAYKILRPGGKIDNPDDYDPVIWAAHLETSAILNSEGKNDVELASDKCEKLGKGVELPSKKDFWRLRQYFDFKEYVLDQPYHNHRYTSPDPLFSEIGVDEYIKVFGDNRPYGTPFSELWTSTPWEQNREVYYYFDEKKGVIKMDHAFIHKSVRCIVRIRSEKNPAPVINKQQGLSPNPKETL